MNDNKIQDRLQQGDPISGDDPEVSAYKIVFSFLEEEEKDIPSPGFAHRVTARLEESNASKVKLWVPLTLGILALVLLSILSFVILEGWKDLRLFRNMTLPLLALLGITLVLSGIYNLLLQKLSRKN